ncbi:MAG TPA: vitamin K epoxide reductase family protein [Candidatus Saccharimonadales bacterium]|nr:vitamin K epoxide reductase family protein [Candidatus Saccharimonadales bacterium]
MPNPKKPPKDRWTLEKSLPWLLLVGGIIVTLAAIALSVEVFDRLKNPSYVPVCNLNPILSCTNVADSNQAHAFGLPNYFIGIAGYAAIATIGVAMLAGAKFKKWFWQLVEVGMLFAFVFMSWLQFQTLYRIGALCLFCMVLWVWTAPMFWYTTLYNLRQGHIPTPARLKGVVAFANRHHGDILLLWFLLIIALILKRFWYYWSTL